MYSLHWLCNKRLNHLLNYIYYYIYNVHVHVLRGGYSQILEPVQMVKEYVLHHQ